MSKRVAKTDSNISDDVFDLTTDTDSDSSGSESSAQVMYGSSPLVLELHDMKKDEPENAPVTVVREAKKRLRKRRQQDPARTLSSTSSSQSENDASLPTVLEPAREEFFDAQDALSEAPTSTTPVAQLALAQAHSEHTPKTSNPQPKSGSAQATNKSDKATAKVRKQVGPF